MDFCIYYLFLKTPADSTIAEQSFDGFTFSEAINGLLFDEN